MFTDSCGSNSFRYISMQLQAVESYSIRDDKIFPAGIRRVRDQEKIVSTASIGVPEALLELFRLVGEDLRFRY